jgi:hypothetical protein
VARVKSNVELIDGNVMADCVIAARAGHFPLVVFLYGVLQLSRHTPFPSVLKPGHQGWWDLDHHIKTDKGSELTLSFAVRVLEVLITGCGVDNKYVRMQYAICLKEFFQVPELMHLFFYCLYHGLLRNILKKTVFHVIIYSKHNNRILCNKIFEILFCEICITHARINPLYISGSTAVTVFLNSCTGIASDIHIFNVGRRCASNTCVVLSCSCSSWLYFIFNMH